ncbi:MAG: hypothetical protein E7L22_18460 [Citrobacter freundii]|nr:hypothetical protein [Citrobacter freundii]
MNVYEMEVFLRGKCLPGDMKVNESDAQYLVRKFSELQSQNAELAVQLANAESKCRELAAENAGLKAVCEDRRTFIMNGVQLGYIKVPTVETDPALETIRVAVSPQESTPATDAFLANVRAQGVDVAIEHLSKKFAGTGHIGVPVMALEWLAQELRKGAAL